MPTINDFILDTLSLLDFSDAVGKLYQTNHLKNNKLMRVMLINQTLGQKKLDIVYIIAEKKKHL